MKAQGQTLEDSFEKTFKAPNTRKQRKAGGQTLEDSFEKTFGASSEIHFVMDLLYLVLKLTPLTEKLCKSIHCTLYLGLMEFQ